MLRLVLRSILTLALFAITVSLASRLVAGVAFLLLQAGSPLLRDWIEAHSASRALVLGTLAGLAPAHLCFAAFLGFAPKANPDVPRIRRFLAQLNVDSAQPWTWVFFSPHLILIVQGWLNLCSHNLSIFDTTSPYSISSFVDYWNAQLEYMDTRSHLDSTDWGWMQQVLRIWLLAASAGYSLAPIVRKFGLSAYKSVYRQPVEAIEDEVQESTMNETIDPK